MPVSQEPCQLIILFDGVCNLCNSTVNFLIKRDSRRILRFAALQSETARKILKESSFSSEGVPISGNFNSIILVEKGHLYLKSTAALKIIQCLGGVYSWAGIFLFIPQFIRDFIYDFIAKNRYRWFGKRDACMVPRSDIKSRFLT